MNTTYSMKTFFYILVLVFLTVVIKSNAQWVFQNSSTSLHLHSVSFVDTLKGWAVGDSGIVLHTTDAGNHWFRQSSGTTVPLLCVSFCDQQNGWATGDGGTILKTTNGGEIWTRVYQDTSKNVHHFKVRSLTPQIAIVLRDSFEQDYWTNCRIWKTKDGGISWNEISPRQSHYLRIDDFHFTSELIGWASGHGIDSEFHDALQIHRTTDGGNTWNTYFFGAPTFGSVVKIRFKNSTEGWAIADSLYCSTDGGSAWSGVSTLSFGYPSDIVMFGVLGYASQFGGQIKRTTNGGITWLNQPPSSANFIESFSFVTSEIAWGVGWNGQIIHTTNGGITSVNSKDLGIVPTHLMLFPNYPNPFNPSTTINYQLPTNSFTTLKIYDVLGREVAVLVNEVKNAGTYSIQWNASQFSSGIYFATMRTGNFTATKKLLLMK